ncbi:MAG: aminotransferase class III-fold pyridoxal phosphate-dependent enzyme [Candidatus Anammoxibacter sp.]
MSLGGAQKYYGVTPDIACFGKAMANGYPISAVTGKAEIMKTGEKEVFISSTFFPNSLSYIASLKTIEILERENVLGKIWERGALFCEKVKKVIEKYDIGAELSGIAPMFFITFKKDEQKTYKKKRMEFYAQLIRRGVFMHPYHHGYIAYRHTESDLDETVNAIDDSLSHVQDKMVN